MNGASRRGLWLCAAAMLLAIAAGCSKPLPPDKMDYAGEWHGKGMWLLITEEGSVAYKRRQGNSTTSVSAPIQRFEGASFYVGVGPLSTKFEVSKPPYKDGNVWKMVVDGVELVRGPGASGPDWNA